MDGGSSEGSEARFAAYVEALGAVLGHADRQEPMRDYCLGLLMPIERKSVEPMAAVTAPAQSLPREGGGRREASILAPLCGERTVVGRCDARQGGPACVACDRA